MSNVKFVGGGAGIESETPRKTLNRRPAAGGYQVGDETRARIVATALAVFGASGFKAATTRDIAGRARVKPAALRYYFGSKLDLYIACVDQIAAITMERLAPVLAEANAGLSRSADVPALIECYCRLQDNIIDTLFAPGEGDSVNRILTWESATETDAAQNRLRDAVDLPIHRVLAALVGRILGRAPDDLATGLHTFALAGTFMVFYLDEARVFSALGWRARQEGNPAQLKPILRDHATAMLEQLARTHGTWPPE